MTDNDRYNEINGRAKKAQVCKAKHYCARYHNVMYEFHGNDRVPCNECGEVATKKTERPSLPDYEEDGTQDEQSFWCDKHGLNENTKPIVPDQCLVCDAYENRKAKLAKGEQPSFLIVCWGISRYYISPAEGGCWGDWTTILETRKAFSLSDAKKHIRELLAENPAPRYNRFSCANRGEDDIQIGCFYSETDPRCPKATTQRETYE